MRRVPAGAWHAEGTSETSLGTKVGTEWRRPAASGRGGSAKLLLRFSVSFRLVSRVGKVWCWLVWRFLTEFAEVFVLVTCVEGVSDTAERRVPVKPLVPSAPLSGGI